jgi:hypothetical protein
MNNKSTPIKIATVLRKIGSEKCIKKAEALEREGVSISLLHLRSLDLSASNVRSIARCLEKEGAEQQHSIQSISFSYNSLLGDIGATDLAKYLPKSIREVGLVGCGIGDVGGIELLKWMKNSTHLQMVCIEENNFSEKLRFEFVEFRAKNPQVLFVF